MLEEVTVMACSPPSLIDARYVVAAARTDGRWASQSANVRTWSRGGGDSVSARR